MSTKRRKGELSEREVREAERESARWREGVAASEAQLEELGVTAIDVMDSEGDDYLTFARLFENTQQFVVRGWHGRRVEDGHGGIVKVKDFISTARIFATRTVKLSPRKKQLFKQESRRRAQSREGRDAKLVIRAEQVTVLQPSNVIEKVPATLALNVVYVREVDSDVIEPVDWLLYTTEPIETQSDVLRIVDIYRARWLQ